MAARREEGAKGNSVHLAPDLMAAVDQRSDASGQMLIGHRVVGPTQQVGEVVDEGLQGANFAVPLRAVSVRTMCIRGVGGPTGCGGAAADG